MFYSHEILSNSQYGVSTIWLVATVGRGTQKKVNRKTIQEVNVPKACEKILDPGAPLALRLQGNLLYGVSRVFARQCGYVLSDAEKTQSDMMTFFRVMQTSALDPQAGKTKRQNIILEDDPCFDLMGSFPSLDLLTSDKDLVLFQSQSSANGFSQMTPLGASSLGSSSGRRPSFWGVNIDLPQSSHSPGSYHLPSDFGRHSSSLAKSVHEQDIMGEFRPFGEDEADPFGGINLDFDADGNLIGIVEHDEPQLPVLPGQGRTNTQIPQMSGALLEEKQAQIFNTGEEEVFIMGEDALPDADAFPGIPRTKQPAATQAPTSETTETEKAAAPNKRGRRRKLHVMLDENDRISRDEFRSWTNNYVENMEAGRKRLKTTSQTQAKKNALAFLYGNGLAYVGTAQAALGVRHPLAGDFAGLSLKARLQGRLPEELKDEAEHRGRHRGSSEAFEDDEDEEQRRVKPRIEDWPEFGRGGLHDLGEQLMLDDDTAPEIGMEAAEAMDDRHSSSMMPWSRAGSALPGSSVRGPGSAQKGMPAPSPLHGRGNALKPFERHSDPAGPAFGSDGFDELRSQHSSFGIENAGLGEGFDPQASGPGLDMASNEFLGYATSLALESGLTRTGGPDQRHWINFEELADPRVHTKAVAAQAFLHVLSLATKNVISVEQDGEKGGVPFCTIRVGIDILERVDEGSSGD